MDLEVLKQSTHYQMGQHYYEMNRYGQAKEHFKQALSDYPTHPRLLYKLAYCEYRLENLEEAYELCTNAIQHGLETAYVYCTLGVILRDQEKWYEAEQAMLHALSLNPAEPSNIATYANLMYMTGHFKKARLLMEEAKRIDPMDSTVLHYQFYMGLIDGKEKEKREALAGYIQVAEDDLYKLIKVGEAAYFRNDYKTAKESFVQAFMLDPNNPRVKEMLDRIKKETHFILLPNRIITKVGGPLGWWLICTAIVFLAGFLSLPALVIAIPIFLVLNIYTWFSENIYNMFVK